MKERHDEIMGSLTGLKPIAPDSSLYEKVQRRIASKVETVRWPLVAASVIFIMGINMYFVISYLSNSVSATKQENYTEFLFDYNLYEL